MAVGNFGVQAHLSMAAVSTAIGSYTEPYDFKSESMTKSSHHIDGTGMSGSREHHKERVAQGTDSVGGTIVFEPGSIMLKTLLPRILGGALSTADVPFAETLPLFDVLVDKVAKRHVFGGCLCNKATFSAKANAALQLSMDIKGATETVAATAFPAIASTLDNIWVFSQGVITMVSAARVITEFSCVIDNVVETRFSNSQTATDVSATDQIITLTCMAPYNSDNTDLYGQGVTGTAATLVFTNGSSVCTFTFGNLQFEDKSPVVSSRKEIFLPIKATARKVSTTHALDFTIV